MSALPSILAGLPLPADDAPKLEWALWNAARGLRVHPLHHIVESGACSCGIAECVRSAGKHPREGGWQAKATTDEATIRQWWKRWPNANIGIATGEASGVCVLDGDGTVGRASVAGLSLPPTYTVETGGNARGVHGYFLHAANLTNTVGKIADKVDIRTETGNLVGAGSVGRTGMYRPIVIAPFAPLPLHIIELANARKQEDNAPQARPLHVVHDDTIPESTREEWARAYARKMDPAIQGSGGSTTTMVAAMKVVRGFNLSEETALRVLEDEWNQTCQPAWSKADLRRKVAEAADKGGMEWGKLVRERVARDNARNEQRARLHVVPDAQDRAEDHGDYAADMPDDSFFDDAPVSDAAAPTGGPPPKGLAAIIVQIVTPIVELFHDPKQVAYAVVTVGTRKGAMKIRSRAMRTWISFAVRKLGPVKAAALDEALTSLEGLALYGGDEREVYLRVAHVSGAIYIDLGDATGRCVEVTRDGWMLLGSAPVVFRRSDAMRPLPLPTRDGKVGDLHRFVNLDDDGFRLFVAWIVAAYRQGRPCAILALHGEQGTAKSTSSRVARSFVDPNAVPVRSPPKTEDDLVVAASHSHVVAYDNLSGVMPWLSDALCRLATGGGLTKRQLYTDDDEIVIEVLRPVIVNGIDEIANRADLAERCIVLELLPIPKSKRKSERVFRESFDTAAPGIFGALLEGVVSALRNIDTIDETDLPRMADFAAWISAAEPGLGFPRGSLKAAYARNRARAVQLALSSSPVAVALLALLDKPQHAGTWEGQPEQMLSALNDLTAEPTRRMPSWPKNAASLSRVLRRTATFLRTVGVELVLDGSTGRDGSKSRQWIATRGREGVAPGTPSVDA